MSLNLQPIALDAIRTDGGTQSRAQLNDEVVADYAMTIRSGVDFPPVTVFYDGKKYWLADGFHRVEAHKRAGAMQIAADVRQGTKRDAVLHSVGANADHGLRRSNADKRRAVETLLRDKEWAAWSDREIARRCCVGAPLVADVRGSICKKLQIADGKPDAERDPHQPETRTVQRGESVYQQDVAHIGRSAQPPAQTAHVGEIPDTAVAAAPAPGPATSSPANNPATVAAAPSASEPTIGEMLDESSLARTAALVARVAELEADMKVLTDLTGGADPLKAALAEVARLTNVQKLLDRRINNLVKESGDATKRANRLEKDLKREQARSARLEGELNKTKEWIEGRNL